jgi:hypothetical protein
MVEWETEPGAKVFSTYRVVVKGLKSQKQEGGGVIWLVDWAREEQRFVQG